MRIAVSGAHRTGKSTLIDELLGSLPIFSRVEEPYYLLEEEGHAFAEMPSLEDFELQLDRSIETIADSENECLFDRCPYDLVAYLVTHEESHGFDLDHWLPRVAVALGQLDLIVFVPIEDPDRVPVSASDYGELRRSVDDELQSIILGDRWGFGVPTLQVTGSPRVRASQVLAHLSRTH